MLILISKKVEFRAKNKKLQANFPYKIKQMLMTTIKIIIHCMFGDIYTNILAVCSTNKFEI